MIRIVIAGATGQVGRHLAGILASRPGCEVRALVRREGGLPPGVEALPFDFEDDAACARLGREIPCDMLLIALGTTRAAAGPEGFWRVDRDYPVKLIEALARANPAAKVGLVSSVGADRPSGLYLRAKAEVEATLRASGLAHAIARPSFLLRSDVSGRPAEWIVSRLLARPWLAAGRLFPRSRGFWKWAPVTPMDVAKALADATLALQPGASRILESLDLRPEA